MLIVIGLILIILGIVGSALPALPGPTASYIGLILLLLGKGTEIVPVSVMITFGIFMIFVMVIDYIAPIIGGKFFGASKRGLIGAVMGAILGIIFFPPLGIFVGSFLGSVTGELFSGKRGWKAINAGIGVLLGNIFVIFLQVSYSVIVAVYFFTKAF